MPDQAKITSPDLRPSWRRQPDLTDRGSFPLSPLVWHHLCPARELARGPVSCDVYEQQGFVGFRTGAGKAAVLSRRCAHMSADLSRGTVVGECLRCPLHGWEFGLDGECARVPAQLEVPEFARVPAYPVEEIGGHVFFSSSSQPQFPFPFFRGKQPSELHAARAFDLVCEMPWYLVGANGFDLQHFHHAHDRELVVEPRIDFPTRWSSHIQARFRVGRTSWRDRLTRLFAGEEVAMDVTSWVGNVILVEAMFPRTTTYGLVNVTPLGPSRARARVLLFVPQSSGALGQRVVDPLDAWVRRWFVREFLRSDVEATAGIRYDRSRMIGADQVLREYLDWLARVHQAP